MAPPYTERQDIGDGDGGVLDFLAQYPKYQDILPLLQQSTPPQNDYMLLSRLKADCDYFLGAGGRAEKAPVGWERARANRQNAGTL